MAFVGDLDRREVLLVVLIAVDHELGIVDSLARSDQFEGLFNHPLVQHELALGTGSRKSSKEAVDVQVAVLVVIPTDELLGQSLWHLLHHLVEASDSLVSSSRGTCSLLKSKAHLLEANLVSWSDGLQDHPDFVV